MIPELTGSSLTILAPERKVAGVIAKHRKCSRGLTPEKKGKILTLPSLSISPLKLCGYPWSQFKILVLTFGCQGGDTCTVKLVLRGHHRGPQGTHKNLLFKTSDPLIQVHLHCNLALGIPKKVAASGR